MKAALLPLALLLAGCSTTQSRRDDPPIFQQTTAAPLADIQGCIAETTAKQNVQFMPRRNGGTFTAGHTSAISRYVFWVIDVEDLGTERRVTVYAVDSIFGPDTKLIRQIQPCLN